MATKDNYNSYFDLKERGMSNNKMIMAAIGGAAAGIAIASLLSSEKGRAFLGKMGESASHFANQYKDQLNMESISNLIMSKLGKQ